MRSVEIERRLRLPAPEEPAVLPALMLPALPARTEGPLGDDVRPRIRLGDAFRPAGPTSPRLALMLLALLALLVGAIASGALRFDFIKGLLDPNAIFHGRGVSLTYPKDWVRLTSDDPNGSSGASTTLIVSSAGVAGCGDADLEPFGGAVAVPSILPDASGVTPIDGAAQPDPNLEDRMLACIVTKPMAPGEIRLVVSRGFPQTVGVGPIEPVDPTDWFGPSGNSPIAMGYVPTEADGWDHVIDGMPAKLLVRSDSPIPGAAEVRTWGVYEPAQLSEPWFIRVTLAGPVTETDRTRADAIAQSVRFDAEVGPLDAARRDPALEKAIDDLDREARRFPGTEMYGCFPRTPGERTVELRDGPSAPLPAPVTVTCQTTVEDTSLGAWQATLTVSWKASLDYAAGTIHRGFLFDATGTALMFTTQDPEAERAFPGLLSPLPPPPLGPLDIPVGSVVQVLPPGINQSQSAIQALYSQPEDPFVDQVLTSDLTAGRHLYVVAGPRAAVGFDWYLVESQAGWLFAEGGWVPFTEGGRPLFKSIEPTCPPGDPDVADLLRLLPAERVLCFGSSEVTLAPAKASLVVDEGMAAWPPLLSPESKWQLFGRSGPDGLDGPIRVALAPSLSSLPTDGWLSIQGHFDDPAATACRDATTPERGGELSPDVRVLRCRETFVVTSFTATRAPAAQ